MKNWAGRIAIPVIIHLALCNAATGQIDISDFEPPVDYDSADKAERNDQGFGFHYQTGLFYRLATSVQDETKQTYLVTVDFSGLNWSRKESSWGLGLHFGLDDSGYRFGVKGLWRTPLKKESWMYLQLAPGVYVGSTDDTFDPKLPGFFFEAELGLGKELALVIETEVLPYENRSVGWSQPSSSEYGAPVLESGTATQLFVGAKAGQEVAIGVTVIAAIVGIIAAASIGYSDGVF